jgi:heme A synthase
MLDGGSMPSARFHKFSWAVLASVVVFALWGAVVRATGSGAGCGSHWPTCNGELVPTSPGAATLIEYVHRVSVAIIGFPVLAQLFWSRRLYPRGHHARRAVAWSMVLMVSEYAIGASIVLLRYTGDNASVARAVWMALHLCNTFLLIGAMTLAAHYAGGAPSVRLAGQGARAVAAIAALVGLLFVGMTGAIAALGDTLFPARDLATAVQADFAPAAHFLVRLRALHPFAALAVAFGILGVRLLLTGRRPSTAVVRWGRALRLLIAAQLCFGLLNMMLLAPTWMQIGHLLLADLVWMALVLFVASALAEEPAAEALAAAAPQTSA